MYSRNGLIKIYILKTTLSSYSGNLGQQNRFNSDFPLSLKTLITRLFKTTGKFKSFFYCKHRVWGLKVWSFGEVLLANRTLVSSSFTGKNMNIFWNWLYASNNNFKKRQTLRKKLRKRFSLNFSIVPYVLNSSYYLNVWFKVFHSLVRNENVLSAICLNQAYTLKLLINVSEFVLSFKLFTAT